MKFKWLLIGLVMLLVTLHSGFAVFDEDYPTYLGNTNDGKSFYLGTGDSAFYSDYSNVNGTTTRSGDVNGDGLADIVTYESNIIYVMNRTLGNVKTISLEGTYRGYNLYDIDSDGIYEIIYLGDAGSFGIVRVYEYSGGAYSLKHSGQNLSNDLTTNHNPACISNKCYFVDATGIVYEYDANGNSFTETVATGSNIEGANIVVDDCTPAWSGNELIFVVDSDGDASDGGYTLINLNNMDEYVTFELHDKIGGTGQRGHINSQLMCDNIDGNDYIFYTIWFTQYYGSVCYGTTWGNFVYLGHDQIFSNNTVINIDEHNFYTTSGVAFSSGCPNNNAGTSQPFLYDVNSDNDEDLCFIGMSSDGCGSTCQERHRVYCYNLSDSSVLVNNQGTFGTELGGGDYQAYVLDFDGNNYDDFLIGMDYYEPNSDSWTDAPLLGGHQRFSYWSPMEYGDDCISYYGVYGGTVHARVSEAVSCDYPETLVELNIFVNETFGTINFALPESSCAEGVGNHTTTVMQAESTPVSVDNDWYCWVEDKGDSSVYYGYETSTSNIHTSRGLETIHADNNPPQYDTIATFPSQFTLTEEDTIDFYCSVNLLSSNAYNYLVLSKQDLSGYPIAFSLQQGGCDYNSTVIGGNVSVCVELDDIVGDDCEHTATTHINFTVDEAINGCDGCNISYFEDIGRIELWRNKFSTDDTFYFDDLLIYAGTLEEEEEEPPQGANCIGFTEPVCPEGSSSCWFYDDFDYSYAIECNGWEGNGDTELYTPTSNYFKIYNFDFFENSMFYEGDRKTIYDDIQVTLDFWINNPTAFYVHLQDGDTNKNSMVFQVSNYVAFGLDYGGLINMGAISSSTWYELNATIDFDAQKVYYFIDDDYKGETDFYDLDVEGFSELKITFDEDGEYRVDNVKVLYGGVDPNATEPEEEVDYVYNPDRFCAINWTADAGERFKEEFCEERGFSVEYPAIGLCVPRACLQDVGLMTVDWATDNIFTTIIIVTAFILIAPLLIALRRK